MNKQLLVDVIPFDVAPEKINESMTKNGGKLVVSGVLQRAEAKNQNGRVYPREILQREAKKYESEFKREKGNGRARSSRLFCCKFTERIS